MDIASYLDKIIQRDMLCDPIPILWKWSILL